MTSDPLHVLEEIAIVLPSQSWMLVGGLMVHCHAANADFTHPRSTTDVDIIVQLHALSYIQAATALQQIGFSKVQSLDHTAPFYRFEREDGAQVDLMAPEGASLRFVQRSVLEVPGAKSALKRTITHTLGSGTQIQIPDVESSLSLKGAAMGTAGASKVRHLQDATTLFACLGLQENMNFSKSMRSNINTLISGLESPEAWSATPPQVRSQALNAIRRIRPGWEGPRQAVVGRYRPKNR